MNERRHGGPFEYRSILTDVLGWVLQWAGGRPFAELFPAEARSRLGAARDAQITVDSAGCAITDGGICTTLPDLPGSGSFSLRVECATRPTGHLCTVVVQLRRRGSAPAHLAWIARRCHVS